MNAEQLKACCADLYSSDIVATLLGPSFHPGGDTLTRRLADLLGVGPGMQVLDVASGLGTTAMLLAEVYGVQARGLDYSPSSVQRANSQARTRNLDIHVGFDVGDAEELPYENGTRDAVVCECSLCLFPNKRRGVGEMARVLRSGGRIGITDVIAEIDVLDPILQTEFSRIGCIAGALNVPAYVALLEDAGFRIDVTELHPQTVTALLDDLGSRLALVGLTDALGNAISAATNYIDAARTAVAAGALTYGLFVATKL